MKYKIFRAAMLTLSLLSLSHALEAQPAGIDNVLSYRVTVADTVDVQARDTYILADLSGGSYTLYISRPTVDYLNLRVTVVQLGATGGTQLTLNTLSGASDFYTSNSLSTGPTYTANTFERRVFVCMETAGGSTYKWVQVD